MIVVVGIRSMALTDSHLKKLKLSLQEFADFMPEIDRYAFDFAENKLVTVDCLRLDKIHPFISGNKWYKLKYSILHGCQAGKSQFLSFGGPYSNHLHALAFAGHYLNIETIGVVRGERASELSPTLQDCVKWGMSLHWMSRERYRQMAAEPIRQKQHLKELLGMYPDAWIISEGGAGEDGVLGIETLFNGLYHKGLLDYDYIVTPVGSGTTLAGLIRARIGRARCLGFSALKGASDLEHRIEQQLKDARRLNDWSVSHDYHFGGFAKVSTRLTTFISDIFTRYGLLLDPVYTGKMLYGVAEYVHQGRIPSGAKILIIHTGGLQGWRGFSELSPLSPKGF